ncbi:MAG: hypothetical protein ACXWV6_12895 [Chitinophagaceae bacterium]
MKEIISFGLLFLSATLNAQVSKVEHFFASSPKADSLFRLFTSKLGTPIVWDYQTWGNFSSGGVSFGNVVFEFVNYQGITKTKFDAIALEPKQSVEEFIKLLDVNKVNHDTIEANTYVAKDGSIGGWSNLNLKNLLPDEAGIFICDYKKRDQVFTNRQESADSLKNNNGGPLGILFLKEIVIGSSDYTYHSLELVKLPGIKRNNGNLFSFEQGPSLRLKKSNAGNIEKIVLKVNSLEAAKRYLKSKNLLGSISKNTVYIDPNSIDGLLIELTDK